MPFHLCKAKPYPKSVSCQHWNMLLEVGPGTAGNFGVWQQNGEQLSDYHLQKLQFGICSTVSGMETLLSMRLSFQDEL